MVKNTPTKADWGQHLSLAKTLYSKLDENGNHIHSSSTVVSSLKAINYTVKGLQFQATRVSAMIAGMECSHEHIDIDDMVSTVNDGLANGALKYTKAKLVHTPKKA